METKDIEIKVALLEERLAGAKEALVIQAAEYQRRLDILNHEAERLREMQKTYLPRETYEVNYKLIVDKIDSLAKIVYIGMGIILAIQFILRFI